MREGLVAVWRRIAGLTMRRQVARPLVDDLDGRLLQLQLILGSLQEETHDGDETLRALVADATALNDDREVVPSRAPSPKPPVRAAKAAVGHGLGLAFLLLLLAAPEPGAPGHEQGPAPQIAAQP